MYVANSRVATAKACVQRRIVQVIAIDLVEAERDVEWGSTGLGVNPREILKELLGRQGGSRTPPSRK